MHWSTQDGSAKAGADYTAASGIATIGVGKTPTTLAIPILGDGTDEPNETIDVTLDTPVNAAIGDAHAVVTIRDDDSRVPPAPGARQTVACSASASSDW